MHAGIRAADAGGFVARALAAPAGASAPDAALRSPASGPVTLVAAGKAAAPMAAAFLRSHSGPIAHALVVSTHASVALPAAVEWVPARHPVPDAGSERAGRRALHLAAAARGPLVVLLSGGASSLLAVARQGITLDDKQRVTDRLLKAGADIDALNTVRKHLSAIKGGWLAASARGPTIAFAVSDVVTDDLSVIGSGPTVADPTTFSDALHVLDRFSGRSTYPAATVRLLEAGAAGAFRETPKPGDARLANAATRVIGSRFDVMRAIAQAASEAGYVAREIGEPVVGEAREAGLQRAAAMIAQALETPGRVAIVSSGETTVRVVGHGRGGRNQEFVLAAAGALARVPRPAVFASVGTDGIDGPTDAAGGIADTTTVGRVASAGLSIEAALDSNDSYPLLNALGDLIETGPTNTNVGDVQLLLMGE